MIKKRSSPADAKKARLPEHEGHVSAFRARSKLSFDRLVEMGRKMGMENPLFACHERAAKATSLINGKEYLNFSTYDYLGINAHPEITDVVTEVARVFGTSSGASRLVGGERPQHRELEKCFAELYGVEDCIVYVSGHATNVSTMGFLFSARDAIFHDGLAHNSLIQGARLSGASRYSYAHNNCDDLEEKLKSHRSAHKRAVIVTEGLFSMDGNIPDLPRIVALKKKYDCMLLVDEAHSLGVLGKTGRGVREHYGIDSTEVDMWMSTLSKAMCGCGGFIAGSRELVEHLKYGSPGFVFSVGMPPVIAAACRKALEIMLREPERVQRLQRVSKYFLQYAKSKSLDTGSAQGYAVLPILVGDSMVTGFLSTALFKRGIYVMPVTFPAVQEGTARLRFFLSSVHEEEHVRQALDAVAEEMSKAQSLVEQYRREHE
ncbi:MAG: aminotransferase class I/II-fold pyridoxal phosphate-dependent enzyme [Desulfovibrio sp.]|jgi:8-amino-7-oxononanoate synthase|nr:aminotransferase class I/II-fold pyridoxal phosphate-dependent enzyme [Desulfovibrio sp.]